MKLSHYDFQNSFSLSSEHVNVLVIEEPSTFYKYLEELSAGVNLDEGNFCLSDKDKILKMGKYCAFVSDIFSLETESKKITNKLFADLKTLAETEYGELWYKLQTDIYSLFQKLNGESLCRLEFDEGNDATALFKAYNVRIFKDDSSLLERLTTFIRTGARYLGIKIFFFVNLKCFLSDGHLNLFYREAMLENVSLFLLENTLKDKKEQEKILVLDKDLCEIIVKS